MSNPSIAPELHDIAASFRWNAEHVLGDSSLLYQKLAYRVADDADLLALAAHAQPHQPPMNLLFGAVHYLLLRATDDPLKNFFPDLARKPNRQDDPFPIFRAFCLENADALAQLISSRRVQTNKVARCALFLPAFEWIARRVAYKPFALLEVGASAGLNLNWDRYAYAYGDGVFCGDADATVVLPSAVRGARPPLPQAFPRVQTRAGIDLNPMDVFDDDAMLWLRALVWPEQRDRAERLRRAIALAREFPPRVEQGDARTQVAAWARAIPPDTPIVLFHSFVLNQVDAAAREQYYAQLRGLDVERVWFDVAVEPQTWPARLSVTTRATQTTLALCDHHGRWLEWIEHAAAV
ncbi:MAG: hypothetical protein HDKAJFGB_01268 [Anaerolineae bacterium]|nr:hypothetical protein [Anaerolineae bacterium]